MDQYTTFRRDSTGLDCANSCGSFGKKLSRDGRLVI